MRNVPIYNLINCLELSHTYNCKSYQKKKSLKSVDTINSTRSIVATAIDKAGMNVHSKSFYRTFFIWATLFI